MQLETIEGETRGFAPQGPVNCGRGEALHDTLQVAAPDSVPAAQLVKVLLVRSLRWVRRKMGDKEIPCRQGKIDETSWNGAGEEVG